MKRKVLATALCAAIMAIAMGFAVVAKTADASLKAEGNFRTFEKATDSVASSSNADEDVAEDVTDEVVVTGEKEVIKDAAMDDVASPSEAAYVSTENELRNALQQSGTIILNGDIQVTGNGNAGLWTGMGINITINGAGHSIYSGENSDLKSILWVNSNTEISLQDITIDATGMDYVEDWEPGSSWFHDYYAILALDGSRLVIGDGAKIICNDDRDTINNQSKGGIFLNGTGIMDGGEISGFYIGGITVTKEFTLESGTISGILTGNGGGGGGINNVGTTMIKGGTISGNTTGLFNNAHLIMINGEVTGNKAFGLINNTEDHMTHEKFHPVSDLNGGFITDTIATDPGASSNMRIFAKTRRDASILISNLDGSELNIKGTRIVSNAPNGIAVYNDGKSKVQVKGGTISANGAGSVAIQNDNTSAGAVEVSKDATITGEVVNIPAPSGSGSSRGSGGSGGSGRIVTSNSAAKPSIPETPGAWVQDQTGWKFTAPNQTPYVNTWIRSKNQWYWVGADSYMRTGWNQIAEKWYYLMPVAGEMKTGWLQDVDSWYYLDETGARKTGWLQDGTKWYYLNQDGKMAVNTTTPDGYKIDGSGAWVK